MLPDPAVRPLLAVDEARHALGDVMGRSAFYLALERGDVPGARRIGRRIFVATAELRKWTAIDTNGDGEHEMSRRQPPSG